MEKRKIPFMKDMIAMMRDEINEIGLNANALADDRVMPTYFTLCRRLVTQQPRTIHKAAGFTCPAQLQNGLALLEQKFSDGADVNPHQSRSISEPDSKDGMFFEWGILHFHLGEVEEVNKQNFIKRTGDILYAVVKDNDVYFLTISPHGHWSDKDLLEIIEKNWPEVISPWKIDGTPEMNFTSEDIKKTRKINVNVITQLTSGNCYITPGGGFMADGTMGFAMHDRNQTVHSLDNADRYLKSTYPGATFRLARLSPEKTVIYNANTKAIVLQSDMPSLKHLFGSFII